MKSETNQKSLTCAVLIGMVTICANPAFAENEPADNAVSGASTVPLGTNGSLVIPSGFISNSDQDWYKITNTAGYSSIVVTFAFQGSGPDTCRLRILGANGVTVLFDQQTETGINPHQRSYTISNPATDAVYYIGCLGDSADGNKSYTLTIDPSPDRELINQINELKDSINRLELLNIGLDSKRAQVIKKIKQQNAKLKKAKSSAEKAKIKALIAKYKRNRSSFDVKIVQNQGTVRDLKAQLLQIVRPRI
jgi:hypothetical protein